MDLAVTLGYMGHIEQAAERIEEAYVLAMEVGTSAGLGRIHNNYAAIAGSADYRRGIVKLREALEMTRRAGQKQYVAWITGSIGDFELQLGNLAEAEALARESIELATAIGDDPLAGMRTVALGNVLLLRGRVDEAQEAYEISSRILDENPEAQHEIYQTLLAAGIAKARGDRTGELQGLRAAGGTANLFEYMPEVFPEIVRRAIEVGDRALADHQLERSANAVVPPSRAAALNIQGLLALEVADQVRLLGGAADLFQEFGMKILQAQALIDLGHAEARLGRDPRPSFERARDILIACDAQLYLPEVLEALAALDAPA